MKIAVLIDQLSPGACPKFIGEEVRYFRKKGHEAEVLSIMEGGLPEDSYQFQEFLDGVPIRYLSRESRLLKTLNFKLPMFAFFSAYHLIGPCLVARIIKRQEYDVVIAHASLAAFTAYWLEKRRGIPYVNYMMDPMSYLLPKVYGPRLPGWLVKLLNRVARFCDRLQANSSLITLTTCQSPHVGIIKAFTNKDVDVLYPGCSFIEELPERRGDYILTIDRWDAGNMPHMLLDVWERLQTKAELKIAGFWWPEELRQSFIKLRDEKGLADCVKVLGPVSEDELNQLYLGARALVFPIPVTINIVVLEAAGHGCPVVMPKGIEVFKHGVEGFSAAEGNLDEFAEYVDRLISDERLAWKMGYAGWQVAKSLSWEKHAKKLEEIALRYV